MRRYLPLLLLCSSIALAGPKKIPVGELIDQMVHRSTLAESGAPAFYVKATIREDKDPSSANNGTVEEYWTSPTKYRRVVKLRDFSQTRIVNGTQVFEENTGDYFPVDVELLANEIADPIPARTADLFKKVDLEATVPGQGKGQCMAEKYFKNEDGNEERVLLAYDCDTGLLIYAWSPNCCYGVMTDYRKFHGKMIAFATKDDAINFHIETLRQLDSVDESLFSVSQPTPPEKQLVTANLRDSEARKLIASPTEIHWPAVEKKPNTGQLQVYLTLSRTGKIEDANVYGDGDGTIKDAALAAVRTWKFQPYTLNGVPAQVRTKLIVPFSAPLQASAAEAPDIRGIFDRIRATSDLRAQGSPAFHLKASFHTADNSQKGTYEETWVSPEQWRREVKLSGDSILEVRSAGAIYRMYPGKFASRIGDDVIDAMFFSIPGAGGEEFHAQDWRTEHINFGGLAALAVETGYISPQGRADAQANRYLVEQTTGVLRGRAHEGLLTIFNNMQPYANKSIGRTVLTFDSGLQIQIAVETLESLQNPDPALFKVNAKPLYTDEGTDGRFVPAKLLFHPPLNIADFRGKAVCTLYVDEHGHVRQVDVEGVSNAAVAARVKSALMSWEYQPFTFNGRPEASPVTEHLQ
jgi:hypothetical protein